MFDIRTLSDPLRNEAQVGKYTILFVCWLSRNYFEIIYSETATINVLIEFIKPP